MNARIRGGSLPNKRQKSEIHQNKAEVQFVKDENSVDALQLQQDIDRHMQPSLEENVQHW